MGKRSKGTPKIDVSGFFGGAVHAVAVNLRAGVIGRLSVVGTIAIVALATVAFSGLQPTVMITAMVIIAVVALAIGTGMFAYASKNPETALMEGADVLAYKGLQIASKEGAILPAMLEASIDPAMPPPRPNPPLLPPDSAGDLPALPGGGVA